MKIVSMVPSWTETLIEAGADVVGRTRFCIHPGEKVARIAVVGGTKGFGPGVKLHADLIVFDREENTKEMAEGLSIPDFVSHVKSVGDVVSDLERLASTFRENSENRVAENLDAIAERWKTVLAKRRTEPIPWEHFPGVIEWVSAPPAESASWKVAYVIWRNPWMAVGSGTFIASVFDLLGVRPERIWPAGRGLYPAFETVEVPPETLMLFSSEPYPFTRQKRALDEFKTRPCAIIDGESFSWFGTRSLRFLERALLS